MTPPQSVAQNDPQKLGTFLRPTTKQTPVLRTNVKYDLSIYTVSLCVYGFILFNKNKRETFVCIIEKQIFDWCLPKKRRPPQCDPIMHCILGKIDKKHVDAQNPE
eukprot:GEMP01044132.1.p2 GENE.GEMP01044132.1~~GEMP01044132.1.p2  ORF type:complete len:105 (-),score=0.19 GEMP01044132.1:1265-1579(-)